MTGPTNRSHAWQNEEVPAAGFYWPRGIMQEFAKMSVKEKAFLVEGDVKNFRAENLKGEPPGGKGV